MKRLLVLLVVLGLFAAACGDDDSTDAGDSGDILRFLESKLIPRRGKG